MLNFRTELPDSCFSLMFAFMPTESCFIPLFPDISKPPVVAILQQEAFYRNVRLGGRSTLRRTLWFVQGNCYFGVLCVNLSFIGDCGSKHISICQLVASLSPFYLHILIVRHHKVQSDNCLPIHSTRN